MARSPLTRQIVALGLALSVVALSLAYPVRSYLQQQAAERAAVAEQHQLEGQIDDLKAQVVALKDPAYIRAEAKRRLQYVTPGDTVYVVKVPESVAAESNGTVDSLAPEATANTPASTSTGAAAPSSGASPTQTSTGTTPAKPRAAGSTATTGATGGGGTTPHPDVPLPWYSSLWNTMSGQQG